VRTLFLRIFLSFWAAMLLVLLSTAGVAWYRLSQVQSVSIRKLGEDAEAALYAGGVPAMQRWLADVQRRYPGRGIYVVGQDGEDILDRQMPRALSSYARRMREGGFFGVGVVPSRRNDPLLLTPLFTDRDGSVYTVMIDTADWPLSALRDTDVRLLLLAFALVVSGIVCWLLARYVSKPVVRLQASARSLAAGNLDTHVGEDFSRRHDELGVLARDFDTMADHLRSLIASKEALLRAMSHELRSPLARMRVALGLARREGADLPRQLDRIELETERLDTIIGQMLQLSQLRVVEHSLPRSPLDLTGLISEVVEDARLEAGAADKQVEWQPGPPVAVGADHDLLRSAIENVLRNAVRFTGRGTAVEVSMAGAGGDIHIDIDDHGPGIPEADLERVFEPFFRVAESRDRDSGGTGLGLAISSRIIDLYGGRVRARNRPGGGLNVKISLPMEASAAV
jgi:two-component system sensor histidine kinase CpxA